MTTPADLSAITIQLVALARTLADLEAAENVRRPHIAEALTYRRTLPGR